MFFMHLRALVLFVAVFIHNSDAIRPPIEFPLETFEIASNVVNGDELLSDSIFRVRTDLDEEISLSISPESDAVTIAPSEAGSGQPFRIFLKDVDTLRQSVADYKIQSLGLISGDVYEIPLKFSFLKEDNNNNKKVESETSVVQNIVFEKDVYDLKLDSGLREKEVAIIKLSSGFSQPYNVQLLGPLSEYFTVDSENDVIYVTSTVCQDCSLPEDFTLILMCSRGDEVSTVLLNFSNKNTQTLRFLEQSYSTQVVEEAPAFEKIVKLATNEENDVTYSLDDVSGLFAVHPTTGILSIQHPEFLTRETVGSSVSLLAIARHKHQSAQTSITIDVLPKKISQPFMFSEDSYVFHLAAGQRFVHNLTLNSTDSVVEYKITEGDVKAFEVVDNQLLYVAPLPKLSTMYDLQVMAQTSSAPFSMAVANIRVDIDGIGSNAVHIKGDGRRQTRLAAEALPKTIISTIEAEDEDDDAVVEFTINNMKATDVNGRQVYVPDDILVLDVQGKTANVLMMKTIMNMPLSTITADIVAQDKAHPNEPLSTESLEMFVVRSKPLLKEPVALEILPIPSAIILPASSPINTFVYQIRTTYPNSQPSFSLLDHNDQFSIDPNTGLITTKSILNAVDKITIKVSATVDDKSTTSNLSVEIAPAMEKAPVFVKSINFFTIPVDAAPESTIGKLELEIDSPETTFEVVDSDVFSISPDGVLKTMTSLPQDVGLHSLVVRATSPQGSTQTQVFVNVDKNSNQVLEFEKSVYEVELMDNILLNSFIIQTMVKRWPKPVNYSIVSEGSDRQFDIDVDGKITTREVIGDETTKKVHILATDGQVNATTDVNIIVLTSFSCQPEFEDDVNDVFHVDENSPPDTLIGQVKTLPLNPKCDIRYHFWDHDQQKTVQETDFASIDGKTGKISSLRTFDFEKNMNYPMTLCIQVEDRLMAKRPSELIVDDVDDHPLRFDLSHTTVQMSESSSVGTVVATMRAMDMDVSQEVFYLLKEPSQLFNVNRTSGEVTLIAELDREEQDKFTLTIGASNDEDSTSESISTWATLDIIVTDVNDNGPLFDKNRYEVVLDKHELPGRELLKVHAEDPDVSEDETSVVFYSIRNTTFEYKSMRRAIDGMFHVDQLSGAVRLEENISDFVGGVFVVVIEAADSLQKDKARNDTTVLRVYIHEKSDVISSELQKSPLRVQAEDIQQLIGSLSNSTGLKVLLKDVKYHYLDNLVVHDSSDVQMIVVNKTSSEIFSADKMLAVISKTNSAPSETLFQKAYSSGENIATSSISPLILIVFVFLLLFFIVVAIFGLFYCFYRTRYERERRLHADSLVVQSTINRQKHRPLHVANPVHTSVQNDDYSVQERQLKIN